MLRAIGLLLPLALDTFAVAAALGAGRLARRQRVRVSVILTGFEAGMPLVGLGVGAVAGRALGDAGEVAGAVLLAAVGGWMLLGGDETGGGVRALERGGLAAAVALGLSVSLDELAIGLSLGLLGVPAALAVVAVALQAAVATQLGLRVGGRLGALAPEAAERLAGAGLVAVGLVLLASRMG
jgi:putative Mn2+ efflux pump MntP